MGPITSFPRQFNSIQLAKILGRDCLAATEDTVAKGITDFFNRRGGGISFDPTRSRTAGVISRHVPFERALNELLTTGQPRGRKWNAELLQAIIDGINDS